MVPLSALTHTYANGLGSESIVATATDFFGDQTSPTLSVYTGEVASIHAN